MTTASGAPTSLDLDDFLGSLKERHPGETEYHQAIHEVFESVWPLLDERPDLRKVKLAERLVEPERIISFRVVWEADDGEVNVNLGHRVQFNSAIGPYKGGLRFDKSVNLSVLKFLGFEQTFKNALTGLPIGGGKGGSDFDPKGKSDREVMRFCQAFMTELGRHIGADTDVPAGDIGVGSREIGYLFGQYKRLQNRFTSVLTGKGTSYGGSLLRPESTGFGAVYFLREMLQRRKAELSGKRVVVSGSGNVALHAAQKLLDFDAKVVALSDSGGSIHAPEGLDRDALEVVREIKLEQRGRIHEVVDRVEGVEYLDGVTPWGLDCDVAMPCATQNELDEAGAQSLVSNGVLAIVEGANMPCTAAAITTFRKAGVAVAPGKAANAGGVAVSGLEQSQNAQRLSWTAEEVDEKLHAIMRRIHSACVEQGEDGDEIDYVRGANRAGFLKVAEAMMAQGLV